MARIDRTSLNELKNKGKPLLILILNICLCTISSLIIELGSDFTSDFFYVRMIISSAIFLGYLSMINTKMTENLQNKYICSNYYNCVLVLIVLVLRQGF